MIAPFELWIENGLNRLCFVFRLCFGRGQVEETNENDESIT